MLTSPVSFLQRPARWMHLMASDFHAFSAAPNFAFELAARRTTDDDMAGRDLGNILTILSGSERVQAATIKRFADRFARFNLQERVIRPSYGLAEATVYVATSKPGQPPETVDFDTESLSAGHAKPCAGGGATSLISYMLPRSPIVRIVDSDTCIECRTEPSARSGCTATTSLMAIGKNPTRVSARSAERLSPLRRAHPKVLG